MLRKRYRYMISQQRSPWPQAMEGRNDENLAARAVRTRDFHVTDLE